MEWEFENGGVGWSMAGGWGLLGCGEETNSTNGTCFSYF